VHIYRIVLWTSVVGISGIVVSRPPPPPPSKPPPPLLERVAHQLLDAFNCQTNTSAVDDRTVEPIIGLFYDGMCVDPNYTNEALSNLFSAGSLQSRSWRYCKNVEIFCIHCTCFIDFVSNFVIFFNLQEASQTGIPLL
jgi:hypothetical protein